jgi:hypothetical protein
MTYEYNAYEKNVERYTNQMNLKTSVETRRTGQKKTRDVVITMERFYAEGNHYFSLILALISMMITWTALSDVAMSKFTWWWAILAIAIVAATTYFGYLSYTKLGLVNRYNEMNSKTDSGRFQLWAEIQDVKAQNVAMLKQMDELIAYHKKIKRRVKK